MKRVGFVCLAIVLILTSLPFVGRAAEPMELWGETVVGTYQEVLSVPVRVKNNTGLMGCSLDLCYDAALFTPVCVTRGEVWSGGLFDNNLESAEGTLRVVWSAPEATYADGVLFTVDFIVKGETYGSYPLELSCNSADTFNEHYERLNPPCKAAVLTLTRENADPLLYSGSYTAAMGEAVDVYLRIAENPGLPAGTLRLTYDAAALTLVEMQGVLVESELVENKDGVLRIGMQAVAKEKGDGVLLRLRFRVKYCEAKTYALQWSYDGGVSCHDAQLTVTAGDARIYGGQVEKTDETVRIPVFIAGNPGLMGMKLSVDYDASLLKLDSVTRGDLLSDGMFSHNTTEGALVLVWSGTEDVTEDGELFVLQFSLLKELEQETKLRISYSQVDTFNSAWQDVLLCCEEITVEHSVQRPACDGGEDCPAHGLTDAPSADYWSHAGIDFVVERGLMIGVSDTEFDPEGEFTRAMMVMVLYRMENSPKVELSNAFTDVKPTEWYAEAVAWAADKGVVKGYGDGTFRPEGAITREEIAIMFCRYAKLTEQYTEAERSHLESFPDGGTVSEWAQAEMNWAVDAGLINGVGMEEGSFLLPLEHASREQLATILMRFLSN